MLTVCCQQIGAGPELQPSQAHKQQTTKTTTKNAIKKSKWKWTKTIKTRKTEEIQKSRKAEKCATCDTQKSTFISVSISVYVCVCVWKKLTNILQHFRPTVLHESLRLSVSLCTHGHLNCPRVMRLPRQMFARIISHRIPHKSSMVPIKATL